MARRPQAVKSFTLVGTGLLDQYIKLDGSTPLPGNLYSCNLSWVGVTKTDLLHIHDTAAVGGDPAAAKILSFRFPTADGSYAFQLPSVGKEALLGMWLNLQLSGGSVNIDIGYD